MKPGLRAHLFVLAANILYGVNYSFGKTALISLHPFAIVTVRVFVSMILFWLVHRIFIRESVERKDHIKLIISSIFGVAMNQLLFFKGLSLTSEMHASLIMITTPILVLIMGRVILKNKMSWFNISGIICGACGVLLLIVTGSKSSLRSDPFGDLFIMLNASSYALFLVITKPLMARYSPFTITKWIFIYGLVFVIPFGISEVIKTDWQALSFETWFFLAFVVFGATFFAYLFNVLGLNFGSPALVSIYIYTQPVIAFLISMIAGTDTLSTGKIIAALLVFTGVALVSFTTKKPDPLQIA